MLLATLLAGPPDAALLVRLSALRGDDTPLGRTIDALGAAAASATPAGAKREFNRLFIGVQRGELVPYASYYLTGFIQDRPLVQIRRAIVRMGIERAPGVPEPEDHIAALAEVMAGLIDGRFGATASTAEQHRFFEQHLAPWGSRFFQDLERAKSAVLYRPVGTLGRVFLDIERRAFALADA